MKNTHDAIIVDFLGVSWAENGNYYIVPGKDNLQISSSNDIDTVIINNSDMMMENMPSEGTVRIFSMQEGAIKAYDMSSENMKKLMLSYGNKRGRLNSQKTLSEIINKVAEDISKNPRAFSDAISDSTAQVTIQKNTADETEAQNAFKSFFNKFKKKVAAAVVATTIFLNGLVPFAQAEKYEDLATGYETQVAEMVGYIANNPLNPQPDSPKGTPDGHNDSSDIRTPQGAVNTMNDILSRGHGRNTTVDEQSNEAGFRNDSPDLDPATRDIRTPQGAVNTLNDIFLKGSGKNLEQLMEESGFMPSSPAAGASRATLITSTIPANEPLLLAGNSQEPLQEISIVSVRQDTPDTTLAQILRSKESNIFSRCTLFALKTLPANTLKSELGEALANKYNELINAPGANKYEINRIFIEYYTNMLLDYTKNMDKVKNGNVIGESTINYGLEVPRDLMLNILFDEGTRMVTTISGKNTVKRDGKTVTVNLPNEANIMFGLYALQNLYGNSYTEQLQNKVKRSDIKFSSEEIAKMQKQGEHDPLMAVAAKYFSGDLSLSAMWTTLNGNNSHNSGIDVRHDGLHKKDKHRTRQAEALTGLDPAYVLKMQNDVSRIVGNVPEHVKKFAFFIAQVESANAKTLSNNLSSATGMYQFINETFLDYLKIALKNPKYAHAIYTMTGTNENHPEVQYLNSFTSINRNNAQRIIDNMPTFREALKNDVAFGTVIFYMKLKHEGLFSVDPKNLVTKEQMARNYLKRVIQAPNIDAYLDSVKDLPLENWPTLLRKDGNVEFNLNNIVNSLKYVANTWKNKENELRKAQDTEVFANQIKPALVAEMKNNLGLQLVNYVVGNQEKDLLRILGDSVNEGNMNRTISSAFEENFVNNVLTNTSGISTREKESLIKIFETLYQNSGNQNEFAAKCAEQSCDIATYMFKAHKDDIVKDNYTAMLEKITDSINNYPIQHREAIKREIDEMLQRGDKLPDTLRERLENMTNDTPHYVGPDDQRVNPFPILS